MNKVFTCNKFLVKTALFQEWESEFGELKYVTLEHKSSHK